MINIFKLEFAGLCISTSIRSSRRHTGEVNDPITKSKPFCICYVYGCTICKKLLSWPQFHSSFKFQRVFRIFLVKNASQNFLKMLIFTFTWKISSNTCAPFAKSYSFGCSFNETLAHSIDPSCIFRVTSVIRCTVSFANKFSFV